MRTRNNRVFVYLDDKEMERFNKKVKKSGLNRSTYLRFLIEGYGPTPNPEDRFWDYMNRIDELASMIDTLAFKMDRGDEIIEILKESKAWRSLRYEIEKYFLVPKIIDTKKIIKDAARAE